MEEKKTFCPTLQSSFVLKKGNSFEELEEGGEVTLEMGEGGKREKGKEGDWSSLLGGGKGEGKGGESGSQNLTNSLTSMVAKKVFETTAEKSLSFFNLDRYVHSCKPYFDIHPKQVLLK